MNKEIEILKGIHPGIILEKKLKEKSIKKGKFALQINEYPQTLTAITKGKRDMNLPLALKIEEALGLEEGYFMLLQLFHDIEKVKQKKNRQRPDLTKFRKSLFWDTDINTIDWEQQFRSVIRRVFERGNEVEKNEVINFYGQSKIDKVLNTSL